MSLRVGSAVGTTGQQDTIPAEEKVKNRLRFGDERGFDRWGSALSRHDFSTVTTENIFLIIEDALISQLLFLPKALGENRSIRDRILSSPKIRDFILKRKDLHKGTFFDAITEDPRINNLFTSTPISNPIPAVPITKPEVRSTENSKQPTNNGIPKNGKVLLGGLSGSPTSIRVLRAPSLPTTRTSTPAPTPSPALTPVTKVVTPAPAAKVQTPTPASISKAKALPSQTPVKVSINELRAAKLAPAKPTTPSTPQPIQQELPENLTTLNIPEIKSRIPRIEDPYFFKLFDYLAASSRDRKIGTSLLPFLAIRTEAGRKAIIYVAKLDGNKNDKVALKLGEILKPAEAELVELRTWVAANMEHNFSKGLIRYKVVKTAP